MEWYVPMTIIPAVGLLILSTSNFTIALNQEIVELCHDSHNNKETIELKIVQLKRLSFAISFLYLSVLSFLLAGLSSALTFSNIKLGLFPYFMIGGVAFFVVAIIILLRYSFKAIIIRQKHLKHHLED